MANDIEKAEQSARSRAVVLALLAVVLAFTATFGLGNPANDLPRRGAAWLLELLLALGALASGGGLMLSPRLRVLLNDERSRQNRTRAFAAGFFVAILAGTALYVASWSMPIELRAGLRLVTGLALAAAVGRYALLEWL